ncbi:MAG: DUF1800 domain-containing protein [Ignavibacteria bacterium]|nr:DUF1800 domain-containing protein [Ignavibacteria bacterium]
MNSNYRRKTQHLFLRAGFGISISDLNNIENKSLNDIVSGIFSVSKNYNDLKIDFGEYSGSYKLKKEAREKLTKEEKQKIQKSFRDDIVKLNVKWINKLANENAQLREKMTLFWHGHFACKSPVPAFNMNQNNTLRKYALGKFGDLLMAVSKDPAMLQFLNNQQNRKKSPNENFARELMELFTLGRGNYTEDDIKNSARAFTGWGFDDNGEFVFRERQHDDGEKIFFGKKGNFTGEDIIKMILENKKTAEFITNKIYKFFVNETNIGKSVAKELADDFYNSDYDIEKLMRKIFTSDWFYDEKNIGAKIKSPAELISGMMRVYNIKFENDLPILYIEKSLGQMLLNPPNVAGWSGGKSWIDTSSLMFRMKLPEVLFKSSELEFSVKDMPDEENEDMKMENEKMTDKPNKKNKDGSSKEKKFFKQIRTDINLSEYHKAFGMYDKEELANNLSDFVLQKNIDSKTKKLAMTYSDISSKENFIESMIMRLMSLPEYQLC